MMTEKAKAYWTANKGQITNMVVAGLVLGAITVVVSKSPAPKIVKQVVKAA